VCNILSMFMWHVVMVAFANRAGLYSVGALNRYLGDVVLNLRLPAIVREVLLKLAHVSLAQFRNSIL
jgi:hypothetical protein